MKKFGAFVLAVIICVACAMPAFAGSWELKGDNHWIWVNQNKDGTLSSPKGGWWWIDDDGNGAAECYYFDDNGYLVKSDIVGKYFVNYNGAWSDSINGDTAYIEFCAPWSTWAD